MRIKQHSIKRAVLQIDHDIRLSFYSEQGRIASRLQHKFWAQKFARSEHHFVIENPADNLWIYVSLQQIRVVCNDVTEFRMFSEFSMKVLTTSTELMAPQKKRGKGPPDRENTGSFARMGLRLMSVAEVEAENFSELNDVIIEKLLNHGLLRELQFDGHGVSDTALSLDFQEGSFKGHMQVGPLTSKESAGRFDQTIADCPPFSFLVDCDYSLARNKGVILPKPKDFMSRGHERIQDITDLIFTQLRET